MPIASSKISVSIVSHMQAGMVKALLSDLDRLCKTHALEVLLTLNLPETLPFDSGDFSFPLIVHENTVPMGFSANQNQAFSRSTGGYFCVTNPDIRLDSDPFPALLECLRNTSVGVVGPKVQHEDGSTEDSARYFPTPFRILCRALGKCRGPDYVIAADPIHPDWIGGMFLLFPRAIYDALGGFDQRYHLYCEDVDICARLRLQGHDVVLCPQAKVIHRAQRSSHRSFKYFRWHLTSFARLFLSPVYWRVQYRKWE
jgi:N-acetylglucosaminyl-diphospho-decaprenol L-rhamnosyltransferase